MGANLYKLLGKKTRVERNDDSDTKVGIRGNQSKPIKNNIDKSENSIIEIEENFSEETFLIGAKKAFEIIVSSYKENNIDVADQLLSSKVLNFFREQIQTNNITYDSFQITELKASILNIEVAKQMARIKVSFESTQETLIEKKSETLNIQDIWTFEKTLGSTNPNWVLAEVTKE